MYVLNIKNSLVRVDKCIDKYISSVNNTGYSNKNFKIVSLCVLFIILYLMLYLLIKFYKSLNSNKSGNGDAKDVIKDVAAVAFDTNGMPHMKRPFLNIWGVRKDNSEFLINIVFITHPFTRDECIIQYNEAKEKGIKDKGVLFLGLSSYSEFPGAITNPHDALHDKTIDAWTKYNYFELTRGWCSCFRPELNAKYIPQNFPLANIAESDFANFEFHKPDPNVKKEYDFIYICLKDGDKKLEDKDCPNTWQGQIRRWDIAKKILDIMCKQYKLKGLLIGRIGCEIPPQCHQLMETTDFLQYNEFIKQYNKCRFMLNCSESDASPRVLTENMCYNNPILVNTKILGGWQYVNENTGALFDPDNLNAFPQILEKFLDKLNNNKFTPREWIIQNYGKYNSGKKLKTFVQSIFKEDELNFKFQDVEYLKPAI